MLWYKHYMSDFAQDTSHLTILEHGAYRLLLDHYYHTEGQIGSDHGQIYRVVRALDPAEQKAVDLILTQFFTLEDGQYKNHRADEEIVKYQAQREHNQTVGKLGGRPRKNPEETRVVPEIKPGDNPSQKSDTKNNNNNNGQITFDQFWEVYPRKVKKKPAFAIWKRKRLDVIADGIIGDVKKRLELHAPWKRGYIPHPTTYLNQELWADDIEREDLVEKSKSNGSWPAPDDDNAWMELAQKYGVSTRGKTRRHLQDEIKRKAEHAQV